MRNSLRVVVLVASAGASLASAGSPPKPRSVTKAETLEADFETVWGAVVETFADKNWPIKTMDKSSGLVASEKVSLGIKSGYADCGSTGLWSAKGQNGVFNVFVREQDSGVRVTVNTRFQELRTFDMNSAIIDCQSTGLIERTVRSFVRRKVAAALERRAKEPAAKEPEAEPEPEPVEDVEPEPSEETPPTEDTDVADEGAADEEEG